MKYERAATEQAAPRSRTFLGVSGMVICAVGLVFLVQGYLGHLSVRGVAMFAPLVVLVGAFMIAAAYSPRREK
jgi:hypothetical protein